MYPDESSNPKASGKNKGAEANPPAPAPAESRAPRGEAAYRGIQAAHQRYFQDVAIAWNENALRLQGINTDYLRACEGAWRSQDSSALQAAQEEYQRAWQDAASDTQLADRIGDAFRTYKASIVKALASANPDDLTFTDLAQVSQSLNIVSSYAMGWSTQNWNANAGR